MIHVFVVFVFVLVFAFVFLLKKLVRISMLIVKMVENNTMYSDQELHLSLFSFSAKAILASSTCSKFSLHSLTSLPINFFLHLQLS